MFGDHIDSGATGAVYKAETKEGKQVAMKGGSDARLLDTEFSIVQKIGSQTNIVEMYARCEVGIQQYIMMELLTGGTLQTRVDGKIYTTSASEALTKVVIAQIFAAVQTMYDKGVAHQDLKPGNIIFGDKDVAKVIDFGEATTEKTVTTIDVAGGIRAPGNVIA
jgi:serine/threonine protein kinase